MSAPPTLLLNLLAKQQEVETSQCLGSTQDNLCLTGPYDRGPLELEALSSFADTTGPGIGGALATDGGAVTGSKTELGIAESPSRSTPVLCLLASLQRLAQHTKCVSPNQD